MNVNDEEVVSGILKNITEHLGTDKDDTNDSKLRRLLNTSTSDEEAENTKSCDLENSNGEPIDKSVVLDTSEDKNDNVIMESDDFDIRKVQIKMLSNKNDRSMSYKVMCYVTTDVMYCYPVNYFFSRLLLPEPNLP